MRNENKILYTQNKTRFFLNEENFNYLINEIKKKDGILTELEEWLKKEIYDFKQDGYDNSEIRKDSLWLTGVYDEDRVILDKIQELKEKYKEETTSPTENIIENIQLEIKFNKAVELLKYLNENKFDKVVEILEYLNENDLFQEETNED